LTLCGGGCDRHPRSGRARPPSAPRSGCQWTAARPQADRDPDASKPVLAVDRRKRSRASPEPGQRGVRYPTSCEHHRATRKWRFAGPMPRPGRDLQRSSRGHHCGGESNGCLRAVGVAMAEVGDDETVTRLFARNDRPERPLIGRLCLCTAPRIATMSLVAGSAASRPYASESPPSFRDEQAAHSPLFGQSQSGAISRETASMTASLFVVRSGAVVALNSGFSVAQALAID
jgi:hypothetical protein